MMNQRNEESKGLVAAREFTPMRATLWMLGAFSTLVFLAILLTTLSPSSRADLVAMGILSSASFLFVASLLLGRYPSGPRLSAAIGVRSTHPAAVFLGLIIGLCLQIPADAMQRAIDSVAPRSPEELRTLSEMFHSQSSLHTAALFFVTAALVPLAEEVFFRGAVYGALRRGRNSPVISAGVTSLGFAFCHFNLRLLLPLLLVGGVLGLLRAVSGSLLPSIAAHMGFNAAAIAEESSALLRRSFFYSTTTEIVTVAFLFALVLLYIRHVGAHPASRSSRTEEEQWLI